MSEHINNLSHVIAVVRPFIERDLDQMKKIEKQSFVDYPWTNEDFIFFLRRIGREHEAYVAEWREHILGFLLVVKSEWFYEVAAIAVVPEFRRAKVGSQLVDFLKSKLIPYGREEIYARVRETNKDGQQFFTDQGFSAIERTPNCYDDLSEGCYKMKYELEELPLKKEYSHL